MVIDKQSWRYRAWAFTYADEEEIPAHTSLCAMFWRTVLHWALLFPFGLTMLIALGPLILPIAWCSEHLSERAHQRIGTALVALVGAIGGGLATYSVIRFGWATFWQTLLAVAIVLAILGLCAGILIGLGWVGTALVKLVATHVAPTVAARIDDTIGHETLRGWKERVCPLVRFTGDPVADVGTFSEQA